MTTGNQETLKKLETMTRSRDWWKRRAKRLEAALAKKPQHSRPDSDCMMGHQQKELTMKSWRTTAAGLAAALGIILAFILPKLGWEITNLEAEQVAGAILLLLGVLGGFTTARDDVVTSEASDARVRAGRADQ